MELFSNTLFCYKHLTKFFVVVKVKFINIKIVINNYTLSKLGFCSLPDNDFEKCLAYGYLITIKIRLYPHVKEE